MTGPGWDREGVIRQALQDGERLVWSGAPGLGAMAWQALVPTSFGVLFAAGAGVMLRLVERDASLGEGRVFMLVFVSIFLLMGVVLSFAGVAGVVSSGRTAYAVTDRRVLLIRDRFGRRMKDFGPREIGAVERKERADGRGHVEFRREATGVAARRAPGVVGFYGVMDAGGAAAAIERLRPGTALRLR